jgi:hypothetical protein
LGRFAVVYCHFEKDEINKKNENIRNGETKQNEEMVTNPAASLVLMVNCTILLNAQESAVYFPKSDAPYWGAVEWLLHGSSKTQAEWVATLKISLANKCKVVSIYNWGSINAN